MNFEEYKKKIQYISNMLKANQYAENVINSKELDVVKDFQYICLCSTSNYDLVNEIIARLSQNGNRDLVEKNISSISMTMWKDLFSKNSFTKEIFINNYKKILDNSKVVTYREVEKFLTDKEISVLIYSTIDVIIKKMCTYDRASFIELLRADIDGRQLIKKYLPEFFRKGDFDITTTYSKILDALDKVEDIDKVDILKASTENLDKMLNRETAFDNETNKLLNWYYDAYESSVINEPDKSKIKQEIDNAILNNFDFILNRSNYGKEAIRILKQFECTRALFEKNKQFYVEKSKESEEIKKKEQNEIRDNAEKIIVFPSTVGQMLKQKKEEIDKENFIMENINKEAVKEEQQETQNDLASHLQVVEENVNGNIEENLPKEELDENKNDKEQIQEEKEEVTEEISVANQYIMAFTKKKQEMMKASQNKTKKENDTDNIQKLITNQIEETDKIIARALQRPEIKDASELKIEKENNNEEQKSNIIDIKTKKELDENEINKEPEAEAKEEDTAEESKVEDNKNMSLIAYGPKKASLFKRAWKKIKMILRIKDPERIGE